MINDRTESTMISLANNGSKGKWFILLLIAMTTAFVIAVPSIALSVLLPSIAKDLGLTLVQAGWVWGIYSLPSIFTGLFGGSIGDRYGPQKLILVSSLLVGITGALRGIAWNYVTIMIMSLLFGVLTPIISMNCWKVASIWFSGAELGLASGMIAMGMAGGFLLGSMISPALATLSSGSWQNVFFLYGGVALLFVAIWALVYHAPAEVVEKPTNRLTRSPLEGVRTVIKSKNLWALGLGVMMTMGAVQGLIGYLPLFLRSLGWGETSAAGALGLYNALSAIFVVPIALWSGRLKSRKVVLILAAFVMLIGTTLLGFLNGGVLWFVVAIAGFMKDGFMAVTMTVAIETGGIGPQYAGTATGFIMTFIGLCNLLAPPIGNSFASYTVGSPFLFWAGLIALGILCLTQVAGHARVLEERIR